MRNKNINKFVAGAVTASVVAVALVPGVSAEVGGEITKSLVSEIPFKDISPVYADAVTYVKDKGIVFGYEDGTFRPGESIKRVHVAVMIARALGADPSVEYEDAGFTDVPETYKWAVNFLYGEGILNGKSETRFGSNEATTRGQMSKILGNAYGLSVAEDSKEFIFTDVPKSYAPFVQALYDNGITVGVSETKYGTHTNVTRGQFATFIYRSELFILAEKEKEEADKEEVEEAKALSVSGVAIENSKEFSVIYNHAIDKATVTGNTLVKVGTKELKEKDYKVEVVGNEVKFTLTDADKITSGTALSLELNENILSIDGKVGIVDGFKTIVVFEDVKAPEITSVKAEGDDIVVSFNEYVKTAELIKIGGKVITVPEVLKESTKTLVLKGASKGLSVGKHDVVLSGVTDILGNKSSVLTSEVVIAKDVNVPTVTSVVQKDATSFIVSFDKEIHFVGDGGIEVTKNGHVLKTTSVRGLNGTSFVVTVIDVSPLNLYGVSESSAYIDVNVTGYKSIVNEKIGQKFSSSLVMSRDLQDPVVINTGVVNIGTGDVINEVFNLSFNEEIKLIGAKEDLIVTDFSGVRREVTNVKIGPNNKELLIEVKSLQGSDGKLVVGNYNVELRNKFVADKFNNYNSPGKVAVNVGKSEKENVKVFAVAESNIIKVSYDSTMGLSAIDKLNYKLDGKVLSGDTKIYFEADNQTVIIELSSGSIKTTGGAILSVDVNVKDTFGKSVIDRDITLVSGFIDNVKPDLVSVALNSKTEIELTFGESIKDLSFLDGKADNDFIVKVDNVKYSFKVSTGSVVDDHKIVLTTVDQFALDSVISVEVNGLNKDLSLTDLVGNVLNNEGTVIIAK